MIYYHQWPRHGHRGTRGYRGRARANGLFEFRRFSFCSLSFSVVSIVGFILMPTAGYAQFFPDSSERSSAKAKSPTAILKVHGYPAISETQSSAKSIMEVDNSTLSGRGIDSPETQIAAIPDLNWAGGTARPRFFQIRGVGELEQYAGAPNSTVTMLVDGVDFTGMSAGLMLFDIDNLRVFRGPQSIGFGPSGYAGTIELSTPVVTGRSAPNTALLTLGNDDTLTGGLAIGDSITRAGKDVGYRITVYRNQQDGFRYNDYYDSHSTNGRNETSGRAKLAASGLSGDTVTLTVQDVLLDNKYDAFSPENSFRTHSDRPGRDAERLKLVSAQSNIKLSKNIDLSTISSYYTYDLDYSYDGDWGNSGYWGAYAPYDYFSQTGRQRNVFAQLAEISSNGKSETDHEGWGIGAYFQSFGERSSIDEYSKNVRYDYLKSKYHSDTMSFFSRAEYPLFPNVVWGLGGRAEVRNIEYDDSQGTGFRPDNRLYGGELTLRFFIDRQDLIYTRLSRGFRGGGFNANPDLPADRKIFTPEKLTNLDAGFRFDRLGGMASFDVNVFAYRRDDQQLGLSLQNDPEDPLSFTYITDNGARGRGFGLESEIIFKPADSLSFRLNGSLLTATFKATDAMVPTQGRREQAHAPSWQYYADAEYRIMERLTAIVSMTGKDAFYFADNNSAMSALVYLTNASLSYRFGRYEVLAWCRNISDQRYEVRGFYFGLEPPDYPEKKYIQLGAPRVFGITFNSTLYFFG
jgi:hypothetical protein